ncbi:MAG: hypothetical protein K6G57_02045 [Lachnospiraceae bacterium]|nr:hypothetical protein [Lachnospiraceae bacterium]
MEAKEIRLAKRISVIVLSVCLVLSGCSKASKEPAPDPDNTINENENEPAGDTTPAEEEYDGPVDLDGDGEDDFFPLSFCRDGFDYMKSPLRDELSEFDIVSNIITESIRYENDGSVYFSVTAPDGSEMRFWGHDIEPSQGELKFGTQGRLVSMDSIGRIYSVDPFVIENSDDANWFCAFGAFDTSLNMHPGTLENMAYNRGGTVTVVDYLEPTCSGCFVYLQPYFFGIGTANPYYEDNEYENPGYYVVSKLTMVYRPETEMLPLRCVMLDPMNYGCYIEGDRYDTNLEGRFDWTKEIYDFNLVGISDVCEDYLEVPIDRLYVWDPVDYGYEFSFLSSWKVGELRDASGAVLDKENTRVTKGMTLDVTVGDIKYDVPINVIDTVKDAKTQHDLQPYMYPITEGDLNVLCVPISWSDERERATDKQYEDFCKELGRVSDMNGNVKDYSDSASMQRFSLSEYMDIASYGKFNVTTYITDWFPCEYPFSEMKHSEGDFLYWDICEWLLETYPDMNWDTFDGDKNGYFDSLLLLNAGDMSGEDGFVIVSFGGAYCTSITYGANESWFPWNDTLPAINTVVYCHSDQFASNTIIHEFSHNLGLIDYYDVSYSGIDAIGLYDMQDSDAGDWNAFSKYSVGWIDPIKVSLNPGESAEYEISPMSLSGDAIVIPAAGDTLDNPFGEYMLVDLFANVGTHKFDAPKFGLGDEVGVRIYHVDARMEARDYLETPKHKIEVPIGNVHYGNDYKENGRYEIELIQAGGVNTFTTLGSERTMIDSSDFFKAGSTFTTEKYSQFFDAGVFDSGDDFGYEIKIVSITGSGENAKAVIRVTRQ